MIDLAKAVREVWMLPIRQDRRHALNKGLLRKSGSSSEFHHAQKRASRRRFRAAGWLNLETVPAATHLPDCSA